MSRFLITYDLVGTSETSEDYKRLIARIKEYSGCTKSQKSVWLVKSNSSAHQVFDDLWARMDSNDRLLVVGLDGAWWNASPIAGNEAMQGFFST